MEQDGLLPVNLDEYRAVITKRGQTVKAADTRLRNARAELRDSIVRACDLGLSEAEASRLAGIPRDTVRIWRGK